MPERIMGIGRRDWDSIKKELGIEDAETELKKQYGKKADVLFAALFKNTYKDPFQGLYLEPKNIEENVLAENSMIAIFAKGVGREDVARDLALALETKIEHIKYSYLDMSTYSLMLRSVRRKEDAFNAIKSTLQKENAGIWNRDALTTEQKNYEKINELLGDIQETLWLGGNMKNGIKVQLDYGAGAYPATSYAFYGIALMAHRREGEAKKAIGIIDAKLKKTDAGLYVAETEPGVLLNSSVGVLLCMLSGKDVFMQIEQ